MNLRMILRLFAAATLILCSVISYANEKKPLTTEQAAALEVENVYTEAKPNIVATPTKNIFIIKLKSNPTTGYSWFIRGYDTRLLTPIKHKYEAPLSTLVGAPGYEMWTFRVKPEAFTVPQQTTIRFVYARPWEGADNSTEIVFRVSSVGK